MSRLKRFGHSLLSGYVTLGVNSFYTLASVPLALHYLGKPEFGLWALVTQISGYIALIDLGMAGSVSRILIDHKDDRHDGVYGSVIKTGMLVGVVQGLLAIAAGTALSLLAGQLLKVPVKLHGEFVWLMTGQAALSGITIATWIFSHVLYAHQRFDISNNGATVSFFLMLVVMWLGFANGFGIYSFLMAQTVMVVVGIAVNLGGCIRLGLLPQAGEWGVASRERFRELFTFGQGMFLISVGSQLINTSQTILLARLLGLEMAATWSVCTRAFTMITIVVWRIVDYSVPALSEMVVRRERDKLLVRVRDIAILMASTSLLCGSLFAGANGAFVWFWTSGKISWPPINDVLLGLWFFARSIMRVHTGLVGISKDLRFLRFIYLIEGTVFIGLNLLAHSIESTTLMLTLSLISTLTFSLPYGLYRTREYFGMNWRELLGWLRPTWALTWRLVPMATAVWWLTHGLPSLWQLATNIALPGLWGTFVLMRHGLNKSLQTEIVERTPSWARGVVKNLASV
jgi:O-antigen/teichoic acid export membrane protein